MRAAPIPDEAIWEGARRVVFTAPDGDLTNPDIAPVEVLVDKGGVTGTCRINVRCVLEPGDTEKLNAGGTVWLSIYGHQLPPFSLDVVGPDVQADDKEQRA